MHVNVPCDKDLQMRKFSTSHCHRKVFFICFQIFCGWRQSQHTLVSAVLLHWLQLQGDADVSILICPLSMCQTNSVLSFQCGPAEATHWFQSQLLCDAERIRQQSYSSVIISRYTLWGQKKMHSVYSSSGIIIGCYSHHTCNILVKWKKYLQPGKKRGGGGGDLLSSGPVRPAGVAAIMQAVMYNSSGRMQVRIEMASHGAVTRLCVMEYGKGLHCCLHSAKARHLSTNWRINGQTHCRNQSIKYI